jgi:integrase
MRDQKSRKIKLIKAAIDEIVPPDVGSEVTWDSEITGFGIRTTAGGTKTFVLKYRTRDEGLARWLTICRVGDMKPTEARNEAIKARGIIAAGGDPAGERQASRKAQTVGELCDAYLKDCKTRTRPLRANTISSHTSNVENHIRPAIGHRAAKSLTSFDIDKLQTAIAAGRSAKRKGRGGVSTGGPGAAARAIAVLGAVFEYGRRAKIVAANPVTDIIKLPQRKRDRFLSVAEIRRLGDAMRDAAAEGEIAVSIAAVRFLLLSGCRRMEVLTLKPSYLDRSARCIRFPMTKTGKQTRPIGKTAVEALDEAPSSDSWFFPAERGDGHFVGLPKTIERLFARAEINDASAHTLRHTFATVAVDLGFSELVIAGLLGHKMPGVTARYAHAPDSALLLAADTVSKHIAGLLNGKKSANVIPMPRAAND